MWLGAPTPRETEAQSLTAFHSTSQPLLTHQARERGRESEREGEPRQRLVIDGELVDGWPLV